MKSALNRQIIFIFKSIRQTMGNNANTISTLASSFEWKIRIFHSLVVHFFPQPILVSLPLNWCMFWMNYSTFLLIWHKHDNSLLSESNEMRNRKQPKLSALVDASFVCFLFECDTSTQWFIHTLSVSHFKLDFCRRRRRLFLSLP